MKSLMARFTPGDSLVGRPPMGRIHAYYGAKGGVGTTTIAINTAIALKSLERRVCLVDGNLQFGDHRVFMDLALDRRSIVDAVTARLHRRRPAARASVQSHEGRGRRTCCWRRAVPEPRTSSPPPASTRSSRRWARCTTT